MHDCFDGTKNRSNTKEKHSTHIKYCKISIRSSSRELRENGNTKSLCFSNYVVDGIGWNIICSALYPDKSFADHHPELSSDMLSVLCVSADLNMFKYLKSFFGIKYF